MGVAILGTAGTAEEGADVTDEAEFGRIVASCVRSRVSLRYFSVVVCSFPLKGESAMYKHAFGALAAVLLSASAGSAGANASADNISLGQRLQAARVTLGELSRPNAEPGQPAETSSLKMAQHHDHHRWGDWNDWGNHHHHH